MSPPLLLLEDDPAIAHPLAYALQREGFQVQHVLLVQAARQALADEDFLAALIDIGLPDGNGLDLCRELRAAQPALPIILLSARSEEVDRVLGLELGADDYLPKPFGPRELVARLRALLRRAQLPRLLPLAPPPALVCDDRGPCAWVLGRAVPLTRLEHALLQALARPPLRVWSREALLDAVWGRQTTSADRTVDTHIKTLRAKLREASAGQDFILTHRGLGYGLNLGEGAAR